MSDDWYGSMATQPVVLCPRNCRSGLFLEIAVPEQAPLVGGKVMKMKSSQTAHRTNRPRLNDSCLMIRPWCLQTLGYPATMAAVARNLSCPSDPIPEREHADPPAPLRCSPGKGLP